MLHQDFIFFFISVVNTYLSKENSSLLVPDYLIWGTKCWYSLDNFQQILPYIWQRVRFSLFFKFLMHSVQFSSVAQSCLTFCDPMDCSTIGFPVHHQLLELAQIHVHVHWVGDVIQPFHPLSSASPPALNLSQHQGLFKWVSSLHQLAIVLEFQLQHQPLQ